MKSIDIALFTTGGTIDGADSDRGTVRPESDVERGSYMVEIPAMQSLSRAQTSMQC